MRIAALYDIHGNLPALDAVLADGARVPRTPARARRAGPWVGAVLPRDGIYWLLIDAVRRTSFPDAEQFASVYILQPPDMLQMFTKYGLDALKAAAHGA